LSKRESYRGDKGRKGETEYAKEFNETIGNCTVGKTRGGEPKTIKTCEREKKGRVRPETGWSPDLGEVPLKLPSCQLKRGIKNRLGLSVWFLRRRGKK